MFEYIFPIFAFGIVVTGIVCKGLYEAMEEAKTDEAIRARAQEPVRTKTGDEMVSSPVNSARVERA